MGTYEVLVSEKLDSGNISNTTSEQNKNDPTTGQWHTQGDVVVEGSREESRHQAAYGHLLSTTSDSAQAQLKEGTILIRNSGTIG